MGGAQMAQHDSLLSYSPVVGSQTRFLVKLLIEEKHPLSLNPPIFYGDAVNTMCNWANFAATVNADLLTNFCINLRHQRSIRSSAQHQIISAASDLCGDKIWELAQHQVYDFYLS